LGTITCNNTENILTTLINLDTKDDSLLQQECKRVKVFQMEAHFNSERVTHFASTYNTAGEMYQAQLVSTISSVLKK